MCSGSVDENGKVMTGKVAPAEVAAGDVFADENLVAVVSLYTDLMGKLTCFSTALRLLRQIRSIIDMVRVRTTRK